MKRGSKSARAPFGIVAFAAILAMTGCGGGDGGSSPSSASSTANQEQVPTTTAPAPATNPTPSPTPTPAAATVGAASLQWTAPQENTDGTALQNLAGYTLVYGKSANSLDQLIRIENPSIDRYVVEDLPAGTYYFAVRAFNSVGAESELSNVVSKVIG